jgi:hypothetical protein
MNLIYQWLCYRNQNQAALINQIKNNLVSNNNSTVNNKIFNNNNLCKSNIPTSGTQVINSMEASSNFSKSTGHNGMNNCVSKSVCSVNTMNNNNNSQNFERPSTINSALNNQNSQNFLNIQSLPNFLNFSSQNVNRSNTQISTPPIVQSNPIQSSNPFSVPPNNLNIDEPFSNMKLNNPFNITFDDKNPFEENCFNFSNPIDNNKNFISKEKEKEDDSFNINFDLSEYFKGDGY